MLFLLTALYALVFLFEYWFGTVNVAKKLLWYKYLCFLWIFWAKLGLGLKLCRAIGRARARHDYQRLWLRLVPEAGGYVLIILVDRA